MKMADAMQGVTAVLLDTAPVIYYVERHMRYAPLMDAFLEMHDNTGFTVVTSPVTFSECLGQPRRLDPAQFERLCYRMLVEAEATLFHTIGMSEAREAARVRRQYNLQLSDAFQVAVAIAAGCQAILTNDTHFKRVAELRILLLDDLEV